MADDHVPENPLAMSDEEFMNKTSPTTEGSTPDSQAASENKEPIVEVVENKELQTPVVEPDLSKVDDQEKKEEVPKEPLPSGSENENKTPTNENVEVKPEDNKEVKPESENKEVQEAPNYENLYKEIMKPFTANGKKIELKDPAEAVQLMQMGANYTRKMQELAPNRRVLAMLGNHGLLDESKLSFLIALDKGDPEAIKKLIMDKGVDPLDIDTKVEPAYREGSFRVSDEEVAFRTHLDDVASSDEGKQTLLEIDTKWDQASKDMLWQQPEVMSIIHAQRSNGIYAKVSEEIDRQRTLGQLPATTPFMEAYTKIGDQLFAAGAFNDIVAARQDNTPPASAAKPAEVLVTDRPTQSKPAVSNDDKARAASPTRAVPGKAAETKNYLAMSDEDFMNSERFKGRV